MKMIVEVIGKVEQGCSNPYECRDDNDVTYIVKGLPRSSQINEWICARLATEFGLPIADYDLVELSEELYDELDKDTQIALGCGPAFGSKKVPFPQWFEAETMQSLATDEEKMRLFLFDYWVQNADRNSGNSNLLVCNKHIKVIDHNNAFDKKYKKSDVYDHLFYDHMDKKCLTDLVFQAEIESEFERILQNFDSIIGAIPDEWSYSDPPDNTLEADIDIERIKNTLCRFNNDDFWFFV